MRFWVAFSLAVMVFFSALSGPAPVYGAEEPVLRGMVTDEGQKMPGVSVNVWDGKVTRRAVSNSEGQFVVRGLVPGRPFAVRWTPGGPGVKFSVRVGDFTFPENGDLYMSMDYGSVGRGNIYTVRLPSNPSTGYGWRALNKGTAVVKLQENVFEQDGGTAEQAATGRPGTDLWKYRGTAQGKTVIIFGYNRPWEKFETSAGYHVLSMTVR